MLVLNTPNNTAKFRTGMDDMRLPELVEPVLPTDPGNILALKLWKLLRQTYEKKLEICQKNSEGRVH
jgi:hypothetical protein